MTVRPPSPRSSSQMSRTAALDYEIAQEQVAAFGRQGRALEQALGALAEYERDNGGERNATHARLIAEASHALWCFIVQREAIGLRDSKPVLRDYRVPAEVYNRMGAIRPR